jgi:hypothetical protein
MTQAANLAANHLAKLGMAGAVALVFVVIAELRDRISD